MAAKHTKREKVVIATFYQSASGAQPVRDWLKSKLLSDTDRKIVGGDVQVVEYEWPVGKPLVGAMKGGL